MFTEFMKVFQEVLPLRLKGIFFINTPSVFDYITAIFFPFLSQKIRERVS